MFYQIVSIVGAVMLLSAYLGLQRGWMGPGDRRHAALNFVGSALLAWVAIVDQRWGFILIEGAWALISLPALLRPSRPPRQ